MERIRISGALPSTDRFLEWRFFGNDQLPQGYAYTAKMMKQGLVNIGVRLDRAAETVIFHSLPWQGFSWSSTQRAGLFTMWEHTVVPPGFRSGMQHFDFLVTPCRFSAELFGEFFKKQIIVCPHGVDPKVFYPREKSLNGPFTILSSATNLRKGFPEVVKAFQIANLPDARLILKGDPARIRREVSIPENVDIVWKLSEADLRDLYQSADLYVSGSRGEGWDLIAFEALACGTPTIVPYHTAYKDWSLLAQGVLRNLSSEESPIKEFYGPAGDWFVIDPEELADRMRVAYAHRERCNALALLAAQDIAERFTWDDSARILVQQLGDLPPQRRKGIMFRTEPLVTVKCVKNHSVFDIGDFRAGPLREGATYTFPAEVGRVLQDAGYVEYA